MTVEFFAGTARTFARVRVLEGDAIATGGSGWVQLRLRDSVALQRGDRFVIRLPSPSVTLGGGQVLDALPDRRHRRNDADTLEALAELAKGDPEAVMLHEAERSFVVSSEEAIRHSGLAPDTALAALQRLARQGRVRLLDDNDVERLAPGKEVAISASSRWRRLAERMRQVLQTYHRAHPVRTGMSLEELRTRCHIPSDAWDAVVASAIRDEIVKGSGSVIALAEHDVTLTDEQQDAVAEAMAAVQAAPFTPPSWSDLEESLGDELLDYLVDTGKIVKLSSSIILGADAYQEARRRVVSYLETHSEITLGDTRDLLETSRRYAQALLEHMDRVRLTKRIGDARVLRG